MLQKFNEYQKVNESNHLENLLQASKNTLEITLKNFNTLLVKVELEILENPNPKLKQFKKDLYEQITKMIVMIEEFRDMEVPDLDDM